MSASALLEPIFRRPYILGGNATITVVSIKSGTRFTYRIRAKEVGEDRKLHFVSVLRGPENTADYAYLGTIFPDGSYHHGKKSKVTADAPSAKAFAWLWTHLDSSDIEIWHAGRCSRCGRQLTTPESIREGLGPVCRERA